MCSSKLLWLSRPDRSYETWTSWSDFLGGEDGQYKSHQREWVSLEKLKVICKKHNIDSKTQYQNWVKSNREVDGEYIPSTPPRTYKNSGWKGWPDLFV